jgi:hypothetical protein
LNNYVNNSKGPQKLRILVDYLMEKEPIFIKKFLKNLETENSAKLDEMNKTLKESEERKNELDEKNRDLKDVSETNNKKVN